jgi:hypothetical protein
MLDKIDVRDILKDHCRTMVLYDSGKTSIEDILLFFCLPILISVAALWLGILLTDPAVNVLITAISILGGLLFNLLVLIYTVAERFAPPTGKKDAQQFLREVYSNIAYAILMCILCLIPLIGLVINERPHIELILNAIAIALCVHLTLTLLMILKRLHTLLSLELKRQI